MLGLVIPLLLSCAVGVIRVRSFAGLQHIRIHWWPLALGSIAVQVVLFDPPVDRQPWAITLGPYVWVLCLAALIVVLIRNGLAVQPGRDAFLLAAVGVTTNLLVVCANGGYMPLSMEARQAARGDAAAWAGAPAQLRNVAPATPDTRLALFGDIIPEPAWLPTANVLSIGDLVLSAAMAMWLLQVMTTGNSTQARRHMVDS